LLVMLRRAASLVVRALCVTHLVFETRQTVGVGVWTGWVWGLGVGQGSEQPQVAAYMKSS